MLQWSDELGYDSLLARYDELAREYWNMTKGPWYWVDTKAQAKRELLAEAQAVKVWLSALAALERLDSVAVASQ